MKPLFVLLFALLSFGSFAQTSPDSSAIVLKAAYAKAQNEHKNVILMFHASWCGWCKKMTASIEDPTCSKFFDDNYVVTYLDVLENKGKESLENPGSLDAMKGFGGDPNGGIPYWLILDTNGKVLGTSYMPPAGGGAATSKGNVGCPAESGEVAYFTALLKTTSNLTDDQLAVIKTRFLKNQPVSTQVKP
jgi:thioredoxin-related protein